MTEHDEIIGLLRGFEIGDNVTLHSGKMRKTDNVVDDDLFNRLRIRQRLVHARILAVDLEEPCYKINFSPSSPNVWVYSDEISHYYEDQND